MSPRLTALAAALMLAGSVHAADQIKVGFVSTLSGPGAGLGVDIRDGFNLAVKQLNGKLGGLPAEVIIADDQQSPDIAKQTADKHAAELKARDRRIGELTRAFREHDLPLPPKAAKKNGTATKGGKSKDREPAAADDGDEE